MIINVHAFELRLVYSWAESRTEHHIVTYYPLQTVNFINQVLLLFIYVDVEYLLLLLLLLISWLLSSMCIIAMYMPCKDTRRRDRLSVHVSPHVFPWNIYCSYCSAEFNYTRSNLLFIKLKYLWKFPHERAALGVFLLSFVERSIISTNVWSQSCKNCQMSNG